MDLTSVINQAKTAEAIALLLKLHHKPAILSQLLKMMYFVDLLSLAQTNQSLSNDSYLAKQSGLIPQQIPQLVAQMEAENLVSRSLHNSTQITLNRYIGYQHLSTREIKLIAAVYHKKKNINPFNLLDWNYDLEFIKNHVKSKRTNLITPVDMMHSLGKTTTEINAYLDSQTPARESRSLSVA
ncbi:MAG: type II toxin-antitoxin system antitoxin SocA domain-containing protein [Cyanobacteria bacterium J06623_7]